MREKKKYAPEDQRAREIHLGGRGGVQEKIQWKKLDDKRKKVKMNKKREFPQAKT